MQGIELSRRFYRDVVRPWLKTAAPGLPHTAALIGYGSELLGLDDALSKDHNWGPRVHLFLHQDDFQRHADALVAGFGKAAPADFLGEPIGWRSRPHPPASGPQARGDLAHGLEVHTLEATLERLLGVVPGQSLSALDWLGFSEQSLLAFTAGAVFHDDDGRLSTLRNALSYFPDDIWLYKIACQWRRIGEEQAFVGRAGSVGDDVGSRIVAGRLARDVMRMGFLFERRYAPYSKWLGSAFAQLPIARDLTPHLERTLGTSDWTTRGDALAAAYLVLAEWQVAAGIGAPFTPVIGPYFERPFTTINTDEAIDATRGAIRDPAIRELPVIGSVDQIADSTPVLVDPAQTRNVIRAVLGTGGPDIA